jgi:hypothetical protein
MSWLSRLLRLSRKLSASRNHAQRPPTDCHQQKGSTLIKISETKAKWLARAMECPDGGRKANSDSTLEPLNQLQRNVIR